MAQSPLPNETARLRKLISDPHCNIRFTRHAREEMAKDEILAEDINRVLASGSVTWVETKQDVLWHVEGRDLDGRSIRVVLAPDENDAAIKIVTAMLLT